MDKLPLELHKMILETYISDPAFSSSSDLTASHEVITTVLNIALTNKYYHAIAAPVLSELHKGIVTYARLAPWHHEQKLSAIHGTKLEQFNAYVTSLASLPPIFRKFVVRMTAPSRYRLFHIDRPISPSYFVGQPYFNSAWVEDLPMEVVEKGRSNIEPAGMVCMLKSFNEEAVCLGYGQTAARRPFLEISRVEGIMVQEADFSSREVLRKANVGAMTSDTWGSKVSHLLHQSAEFLNSVTLLISQLAD